MGKFIDLTGERVGRLKVLYRKGTNNYKKVIWLCRCDCGNQTVVTSGQLRNGHTRSCGCLKRELSSKNATKHGLSGGWKKETRLYSIWKLVLSRCRNKNNPNYKYYGGREITVCDEWLDFANFHKWAMANGYCKNLTIDRINNDGDYCPENCRWATRKAQSRNSRRNRLIEYNGKTRCIQEWAEITGFSNFTIKARLNRGWSAERTLETPIIKQGG